MMDNADYRAFIAAKAVRPQAKGLKRVTGLPDALKPFQRDIVKWALSQGRCAIFAGTGLGKTIKQLAWAQAMQRHTKKRVIILTPLAVAHQTVQEAVKFGIPDVEYAADHAAIKSQIVVTNYDRVEKFDMSEFGAVVLDECFARGTKVDTPYGKKDIENIREGDYIINASGVDVVVKTHAREVPYAVKVTAGLSNFIASPNHPVFTQRGWVAARNLRAGDYALETGAAMRLVRGELRSGISGATSAEVLREILLSEMADEHAGAQSESSYAIGGGKTRGVSFGVPQIRKSSSSRADGENTQSEPNEQPGYAGEAVQDATGYGPHHSDARRERPSTNGTAIKAVEDTGRGLDIGTRDQSRQEDGRIPHPLQGGHRSCFKEDSDRSGRPFPQITASGGSQEGRQTSFVRVDCVEVLELGHPDLDRCRDADGKLYFYDLQASRHPSFSVNGLLVHNSSIIKAHSSKTRQLLIDLCRDIPYRLCCTATPAPNDYVELGNHAEFLGVLSAKEMLATWFVHDGSIRATNVANHGSKPIADWRLKGHAEKDFWRWIATWSVMIRHPRDIGYDDTGYDLPPLIKHQITVPVEYAPDLDMGTLFPIQASTLQERRGAARSSIAARVQAAADIVNAAPDRPWLIWCHLNDEADALRRAIPSAVEVRGSDDADKKTERLLGFANGSIRNLVTKSSIAGMGLNFQVCSDMIFVGLNDSFEQVYQSIRRCWRFGQTMPVNVYMIAAETEGAVVANLEAKEAAAEYMGEQMALHMKDLTTRALKGRVVPTHTLHTKRMELPSWM